MSTKKEVQGVNDIVEHYKNDQLMKGFYKNIRIDPDTRRDHRTKNDDWGPDTYMIVADFQGYTGQCIGMANFCE
jgi:hypothetical protein